MGTARNPKIELVPARRLCCDIPSTDLVVAWEERQLPAGADGQLCDPKRISIGKGLARIVKPPVSNAIACPLRPDPAVVPTPDLGVSLTSGKLAFKPGPVKLDSLRIEVFSLLE
jgi:hypothetical protein